MWNPSSKGNSFFTAGVIFMTYPIMSYQRMKTESQAGKFRTVRGFRAEYKKWRWYKPRKPRRLWCTLSMQFLAFFLFIYLFGWREGIGWALRNFNRRCSHRIDSWQASTFTSSLALINQNVQWENSMLTSCLSISLHGHMSNQDDPSPSSSCARRNRSFPRNSSPLLLTLKCWRFC